MESAAWLRDGERLWLAHRGVPFEIDRHHARAERAARRRAGGDGKLRASMNGRVVAVAVARRRNASPRDSRW